MAYPAMRLVTGKARYHCANSNSFQPQYVHVRNELTLTQYDEHAAVAIQPIPTSVTGRDSKRVNASARVKTKERLSP
jgi:hypothetical protein